MTVRLRPGQFHGRGTTSTCTEKLLTTPILPALPPE